MNAKLLLSAATLVQLAFASAVLIDTSLSQVPQTPLAGAPALEQGYPNGERLQSKYESIIGGVELPGARRGMRGTALGFAAAAEIQLRLPEGFTLKEGVASRVMHDMPGTLDPNRKSRRGPGTEEQPASTEKSIVLYPLAYKGVALSKGTDYLAIVSNDGRLLATRERNVPAKVDATEPTVPAKKAIEVAKQDASLGDAKVNDPKLEIWVDGRQMGHLTWTFIVESGSLTNPRGWRYWVGAVGEPKVLNKENTIYHTHFGTGSGTLWPNSPLQTTANRPLGDLELTRTGGGGGTQITGEDGRYGFPSGTGNATITANLGGPNAVIQNMAGTVMNMTQSGTPASPIDLNFGASSEFEFSQVTAFYWTNAAHRLANSILAPGELAALPTRVNIDASCNAFYDFSSINFFRAGGSCPNTAYADVVLHEYGHGIDHQKGGILDGGYSEGYGDAMAILGTKQSCLGRDFFGAGTCLRPATDLILWPPSSGEGVHQIGRRYAGFTWELVQQLKKTFSEDGAFHIATQLIIAAAAANPSHIPDAVYLSFLADDTDGNLSTCSPHQKELQAAADSRKIPRPSDCAAAATLGVPGSSAQFPWTPAKQVNANSNILEVKLHLDQPMEIHISANSSVRSLQAAPLTFTTGFYNQVAPNVMWTDSLRRVTVQHAQQWVNFGSMFAIKLPAGDHTFYWKIWVSGGTLEFSSGTILVEAFIPSGTGLRVASLAEAAVSAMEPKMQDLHDESGQAITRIEE
jgi:hypothetical protein